MVEREGKRFWCFHFTLRESSWSTRTNIKAEIEIQKTIRRLALNLIPLRLSYACITYGRIEGFVFKMCMCVFLCRVSEKWRTSDAVKWNHLIANGFTQSIQVNRGGIVFKCFCCGLHFFWYFDLCRLVLWSL
jgi:hypothetical protein